MINSIYFFYDENMAVKKPRVVISQSDEKHFLLEKETAPLLPRKKFITRVWKFIFLAVEILIVSLLIGVLGYRIFGWLSRVDSLLNASMILGGMWPVDVLKTDVAKIFASFYALYSGILLLSVFGLIMAPIIHRVLHKMHLNN